MSPDVPQADAAARQVLERRAADIARRGRGTAAADPGRTVSLLAVRRGQTVLGLPLEAAVEVRRVIVSRLPARTAGSLVVGFFTVRGRISSVADLLPLLEPETAQKSAASSGRALVALLAVDGGELGLLIDEVLGPRRLTAAELSEARSENPGLVLAVTPDLLHVVDVSSLATHPRIVLRDL